MAACPFCEVEGSEWELECSSCNKQLPFCIASGNPHMPAVVLAAPQVSTLNAVRGSF